MQGYKILGKRLKVEFKKGEGEEEEKPDTKSSVDDERLIGYLRAISAQNVVQSLKQDLEVDPPSEEPTEPTSWRLCAESVLAFGRFVYVSFTIQVVRACRTSKKRLPEEEVPWNDGKNMLVSEHPILSCQYQGTKKKTIQAIEASSRCIIKHHLLLRCLRCFRCLCCRSDICNWRWRLPKHGGYFPMNSKLYTPFVQTIGIWYRIFEPIRFLVCWNWVFSRVWVTLHHCHCCSQLRRWSRRPRPRDPRSVKGGVVGPSNISHTHFSTYLNKTNIQAADLCFRVGVVSVLIFDMTNIYHGFVGSAIHCHMWCVTCYAAKDVILYNMFVPFTENTDMKQKTQRYYHWLNSLAVLPKVPVP